MDVFQNALTLIPLKKNPFMENAVAECFGSLADGRTATLYQLTNHQGLWMTVTDYGATITSLQVGLNGQKATDVVLGFDDVSGYEKSVDLEAAPYLGAVIGRWAGRINKGKFSLNGTDYQLHQNNGGHALHGGDIGFSQVLWELEEVDHETPSITFSYFSPDGDENFPGDLKVWVRYELSVENELIVDYTAESSKDTIINLTQHSYFNLDGHDADIKNLDVQIHAGKILETSAMIPTGNFIDVSGTPFDFTSPRKCPESIDMTLVLDKTSGSAATLYSALNNLKMMVTTTQPAVHVYVGGNCFGQIKGKGNTDYHPLSGICFETQNFPDAPNHPHFPNPVLKKGDTYRQKTVFKFETK